jgi:ABC-type transport system involved in multi-copper enzyme maturation permease subunit
MRLILSIALLSIKESFRNKVLYFIFVIALLFIVLGKGCNPGRLTGAGLLITAESTQKVAMTMAFHFIVFWSMTLCGLLSTGALSRELENGTLIMVLSRPVKRSVLIAGKLLSTLSIALFNLFVLGGIFFLLFYTEVGILNFRIFISFALMTFNLLMVSLMGFLLPLFLPRLIASMIGFLVYLTSIWLEIPYYFDKVRTVWEPSSTMDRLHTLFPKIGALQFIGGTLISSVPSMQQCLVAMGNVLLYSIVCWCIILILFARKQL